jgi:hypothetical protein
VRGTPPLAEVEHVLGVAAVLAKPPPSLPPGMPTPLNDATGESYSTSGHHTARSGSLNNGSSSSSSSVQTAGMYRTRASASSSGTVYGTGEC